jgi:hypothetical protein
MSVEETAFRVDGWLLRIARLAAEGYDSFEDLTATLIALRRRGRRVDLFTFVQNVPDRDPHYAYFMEWDNVAAVSVSTFDHWWRHQVSDKVRNQVRRARKSGVTVREVPFDDALVGGISAIYNESPLRQGRAFWHYGKGLDVVRQENATFAERSVFLGAYHGPELIGFAKLVLGARDARLMQIVAMLRHRDKSPSNALIAAAVCTCVDRNIPYLVYSKFRYGRKQDDGLNRFKRSNGFQQIDLPRFWVALTQLGRLALRLHAHRDVTAYLPEMALVPLRRTRTLWSLRRSRAVRSQHRLHAGQAVAAAVTQQLIRDA